MANELDNGHNPHNMPDASPELRERVRQAVSNAEPDFWCCIADHFPEIKSGDVDPWDAMILQQTLEKHVLYWYKLNKS